MYVDSTQGWIAYSGFNALTPGYPVSYLAIAGGGSGGINSAGGGGAGGLLNKNTAFIPGITYSFVIGAGGAAVSAIGTIQITGNVGSNTTITAISSNPLNTFTTTLYGGGYGSGITGGNGGSGGGNLGKGVYPGSSYISVERLLLKMETLYKLLLAVAADRVQTRPVDTAVARLDRVLQMFGRRYLSPDLHIFELLILRGLAF